jgi:hypothetical protein
MISEIIAGIWNKNKVAPFNKVEREDEILKSQETLSHSYEVRRIKVYDRV